MMNKFVKSIASVALSTTLLQAGVVVIDNFNTGAVYLNGPVAGTSAGPTNIGCIYQNAQQVNSACGSVATATATAIGGGLYSQAVGTGPNGNAAASMPAGADAVSGKDTIGNARFSTLNTTQASSNSSPGSSHLNVNGNIAGALALSTDASTAANAVIKWDGGFSNTSAIGLGLNLDLLAAGTGGFILKYMTDNAGVVPPTTTILITVYSDLTHFSTSSFTVPVTGFNNGFNNLYRDFSTFIAGTGAAGAASFSNVRAITMSINAPPGSAAGLDFVLDEFSAGVPEPSTYFLTGLALSAAAMLRRRNS
jgi:hypothetical protein